MIWWKVIIEKSLDLRGVLGYNWGLKDQGSWAKHETWNSKGGNFDEGRLKVMCNHVQSYAIIYNAVGILSMQVAQICPTIW